MFERVSARSGRRIYADSETVHFSTLAFAWRGGLRQQSRIIISAKVAEKANLRSDDEVGPVWLFLNNGKGEDAGKILIEPAKPNEKDAIKAKRTTSTVRIQTSSLPGIETGMRLKSTNCPYEITPAGLIVTLPAEARSRTA